MLVVVKEVVLVGWCGCVLVVVTVVKVVMVVKVVVVVGKGGCDGKVVMVDLQGRIPCTLTLLRPRWRTHRVPEEKSQVITQLSTYRVPKS